MKWTVERTILASFAASLLFFITIVWIGYLNFQDMRGMIRQANHTVSVLDNIDSAFIYLMNAETDQRGFLLTGDERYLESYATSVKHLDESIEQLWELLNEDPKNQSRVHTLETLLAEKLKELDDSIRLRQRIGYEAIAQIISTGHSENKLNDIRSLLTEMKSERIQSLYERKQQVLSLARETLFYLLAIIGMAFLIGVVAPFFILRSLGQRRQAEEVLARHRDHLEDLVAKRTNKLTDTIAMLQASEERFRTLLEAAPEAMLLVDQDGTIILINAQVETLFGYTRDELLGKRLADLIPERLHESHPSLCQDIMASSQSSHDQEVELVAMRKDGTEFPVEIRLSPLEAEEGRLVIVGIRDTTRRKQAEALAQTQYRRLNALYNSAKQLATSLDTGALAEKITRTCVQDFGADLAWLGRAEADGQVSLIYHFPTDSAYTKGLQVRWDDTKAGNGPTGKAIREGLPLIVADLGADKHFAPWREAAQKEGFISSAAFPLISGDHVFGALNLYSSQPDFFNEERVAFFRAYAHQAAAALDNACLHEDLRQRSANMEAMVAERTAELDSFFSLSLDMLCILDFDGYFKRLNPAWMKTLGFSLEELMARPLRELIHPDDVEATLSEGRRLMLSGGQTTNYELRMRTKDGDYRWLQWVAVGHPEAQFIYAVARDVTEQKREEKATAHLAAVVTSADAAIISKSLDGTILSWNPAAERMYGYSASEVIGKSITLIVPPDRQEELNEFHERIQRGERIDQFETVRICRNGQRLPVSLTMSPLQDASGNIVGISTFEMDISEHIRREKELQLAKEEAEAANRAKSQFLSNISHELRTPLNAIIGFSDLLHKHAFGELNARQSRYVDNILTSSKHLLALVNDILDLSRIEAGHQKLEFSKVDVASIIASVQTVISPLAQEKHITLTTHISPQLPPLTADPVKFNQILYNLLSNAIKFTDDGGRVEVVAKQVDASQAEAYRQKVRYSRWKPKREGWTSANWLLITVTDNGIGIQSSDLERIFDEFEQVHSSYGHQQLGTGLGLALSRSLVSLHGGLLWAESKGEGKGSTFYVLLPLERRGSASTRAPEDEVVTRTDGQPLVLVVEDDPMAAELLSHYLSEANFDVAVARDAVQSLELAHKYQPDVITLDFLLPEAEDGYGVLAKLKSNPLTASIPVVVVSIVDNQQHGLAVDAVDWLVKPIDPQTLIAKLDALTAKRSSRTVLVVDEDPWEVEFLDEILSAHNYRVLAASNGKQCLDLALREKPDLIILELLMPGMNGFEIVQQLRAHPNTVHIPIMIYNARDLTQSEREELNHQVQSVTLKNETLEQEELLSILRKITNLN